MVLSGNVVMEFTNATVGKDQTTFVKTNERIKNMSF